MQADEAGGVTSAATTMANWVRSLHHRVGTRASGSPPSGKGNGRLHKEAGYKNNIGIVKR